MGLAEKSDFIQPAIVIPAYRRPQALRRLLESLNRARYPAGKEVTLLISIDGGADEGTRKLADSFRFDGGACRVVHQETNLGLREHVLWCGDRTDDFDAVIVLEEDLMVAPDFYEYTCAALDAYRDSPSIGGIALYRYEFNEFAKMPFVPLTDRYDAFFMMAGCSSGQAWSRRHWTGFRKWMAGADSRRISKNPGLPAQIRSWPASSWKKYYGAWLAETGRYMVYPQRSKTTNCSDPGGKHVSWYFSDYQVALPLEAVDGQAPGGDDHFRLSNYRFPPAGPHPAESNTAASHSVSPHPTESAICYDAFMEPCGRYVRDLVQRELADRTGPTDRVRLEFDFHGIKPKEVLDRADWCVTIRPSSRPDQSYPLHFRPLEHNLAWPAGTDGVFVLTRPEFIERHDLPAAVSYRLHRYYMRGHPERPAFFKGYMAACFRRLKHRVFG